MAETRELKDDAEITLGTGKLLGIFFGLAAICAVFFTIGYMLGRSSAAGAKTEIVNSIPSGSTANKPSAANSKPPDIVVQNCPAGSANCQPTPMTADSANVQAVAGNPQSQPSNTTDNAATNATSSPPSAPNAEIKNVSAGSSFIVQVAAVSKQEDAEYLVAALRKKQYPVFLAAGGGDTYFRVQVGPFTDAKEAEATRARLAGEGYNPIIKK
ncbi:MAG TPA: SPOR domain-containing protein [Candidatus Angelobacter sp.]|jgi:cell division septation protein DedD|nr:SPOR domain-containing protein [Candidatus Angelobacter sp.]